MKKYKSIIFDLDGTLIDSEKNNAQALLKLLHTKRNLTHLAIEDIVPKMGRTGKLILKDFDVPEEEIDAYLNHWIDLVYENENHAVEMFPGVEDMLKSLKQKGAVLGIVSSKTREVFNIEKKHMDIEQYFDFIVLSDDTSMHKPNPAPLLKFLELSKLGKSDCIYIGDTFSDLICARDSGVDFGVACWGTAARFEHEQNILRLHNPAELLELI